MIIWPRMSRGVAPMARRMPISVVRSLTVTIMMLLTPMAPASMVPRPMSRIRKLIPTKRLSISENISSVLSTNMACLSSGLNLCSRAMTSRSMGSTAVMLTPDFPVMHIRSTTSPLP